MSKPADVIEILSQHISEARRARMADVVAQRMKGLTVVLEDLYDAGNRSAVYRTAEGHGVRDVHVIRPERATKPHARDVSRGSEKWIEIHRHESTLDCLRELRRDGFAIIASDLESARPLQSYTFERPTAVVFGNEHAGISDEMRAEADGCFLIPMLGFTQSYNISVAAALTIAHARRERERAIGRMSDLDPAEATELLASYMHRSLKTSDAFLERAGGSWIDPYA